MPHWVYIGEASLWTVKGLHVGMSVQTVQQINGNDFLIGGFNDVSHGVVEDWQLGTLAAPIGPCDVNVEFGHSHLGVPVDLLQGLEAEGTISSQLPVLGALGTKIEAITIFYAWQ